jgi:hypothetical protein
MTTSSGSAALAGNPAEGVTADAGTTTTTEAAATTTTAADAATTTSSKFYEGFKDESLRGFVQNKGFEDAEALANSYANLEKLVGKDKVPMPKDDSDVEGWDRVYKALGRPDKPDAYQLPTPEGADPAFSKTAGEWFHEAGISQKQAQTIASKWNAFQQEAMAAQEAQFGRQADQDMTALKTEWGQAYDEKVQQGRQYVRELGLNEKELDAIERAVGTKRMLSIFSEGGAKLGEATAHGFEGGKGQFTGKMTPAQAQARLNDLKKDQDWMGKYLNGDADKKAEMEKLMMAVTPSGNALG